MKNAESRMGIHGWIFDADPSAPSGSAIQDPSLTGCRVSS